MSSEKPPLSFDKWTRNERLMNELIARGLVVMPVLTKQGHGIDYLMVSTGMPDRQGQG